MFEQAIAKLDTSNCDASLKEISKLLEYYQDKIPVKDIEVPEHGLEQLESCMKKVIESVNNLSHKHHFEVYHQLGNANIGLKDCAEVAKRCKEKLAETERLKLQEALLKISDGVEF